MEFKRREFLVGAVGLVPFARAFAAPEEAPVMRLGVMTDTHVGKTVASCARVRKALELFKEKGAELIINNGDIADWHYPTGYQAYRQVSEEVFGADYRPQVIFTYAWHDAYAYKGHARDQAVNDAPAAFEDARRLLGDPNGHTAEIRFKGYTFLVMPQFTGAKGFLSWSEYEAKVAAACRANPGKPVFVVDHVPPFDTVYNSCNWGSRTTRNVLNKYPQVVNFSGHVHGSLRNDLFIWQKEFTVINSGCLQVWQGLLAANAPESKQAFGVLTVDVYPDRLLVRRWDVRDMGEIDPEHPWVVPLPFVAESAPYLRERRAAAEPKPYFHVGDTATVAAEGNPFTGFRISFPEVVAHAMKYRIAAQRRGADGKWATFTWLEIFSDYWVNPRDRTGRAEFLYKAEYFDPGGEYRFEITPVNQYGSPGASICVEAKAPVGFAPATSLYVCDDPAKELEFGNIGQAPALKPDADGYFGPVPSGRNRLMLPDGLFKGPRGTRFRALLDMRTVQRSEGSLWSVKFQDPTSLSGASTRIPTPPGDSGDERYVLELVKRADVDTYCIQFDWGAGGRVKFNRVKVERLDGPVSP